MAHYRAYLLDYQGNIQAMRRIECEGDQEARVRANRFVGNFPVELWTGARKVARFDPRATDKPSA
jgi:hypothetical protein